MSNPLSISRMALAMLVPCGALLTVAPGATHAAGPNVLRVGTFNSIPGTFASIQAAVDAAQPGDWILVGPGVYHEAQDYAHPAQPAGVWIQTSNLHLRGMNRNSVIVDGTKTTTTAPCSSSAADQDPGPSNQGRNGIEATIVGVGIGLKQKLLLRCQKSMLRCTFRHQNLRN